MKKISGKKLIVLMMVLALIIGCTVGGTLAWLITSTDPVVNTFTAGNIHIELNEDFTTDDKVVIDGKEYDACKLLPGDAITKAPRVKVLKGSEPCYVRMFTVVWWADKADSKFNGSDSAEWFTASEINQPVIQHKYIDITNNEVLGMVFEVIFENPVDASSADVTLPAPYTKINIPFDLSQEKYETLEGCQVIVIAQAIQKAGFADAQAAFDAAGYPQADIPLRGDTAKLPELIEALKNQD